MRKTDDEIVAGLKTCGIPPLSGDCAVDNIDSYEYVLRMRIDRLKASAIDELTRELDVKRAEVERLEKETPAAMWLADLAEFEVALGKYTANRDTELRKGCAELEGKKKAPVKRRIAV